MRKHDLSDLLVLANERARQHTARVDELLRSNTATLERARAAETDRRLALELLGKCANLLPGGLLRDEAVAFIKARMAR
jgi:hypothetical protein